MFSRDAESSERSAGRTASLRTEDSASRPNRLIPFAALFLVFQRGFQF
jgi:hypothetical protein